MKGKPYGFDGRKTGLLISCDPNDRAELIFVVIHPANDALHAEGMATIAFQYGYRTLVVCKGQIRLYKESPATLGEGHVAVAFPRDDQQERMVGLLVAFWKKVFER